MAELKQKKNYLLLIVNITLKINLKKFNYMFKTP